MKRDKQAGFSIVEARIAVAAIVIVGAAGWFVYQWSQTKDTNASANASQSTNQQKSTTTTQPPADPYAGWKTFTDNASTHSSGISIRYL